MGGATAAPPAEADAHVLRRLQNNDSISDDGAENL